MKKLKKLSIKFIKFSIFGIIVYGGWLAYQKWESFKPVLAKLEEKHPEKYAQMWEEATSLHISETKKLYRELDKMTLADIIDLRYNNFLEKIKCKSIMRAKANLYLRKDKQEKHQPHTDYPFSHKGCLFYINTNNGETYFGKEKVLPVANRMVFFDPGKKHSSSVCSDNDVRITINFNYF